MPFLGGDHMPIPQKWHNFFAKIDIYTVLGEVAINFQVERPCNHKDDKKLSLKALYIVAFYRMKRFTVVKNHYFYWNRGSVQLR